MPPIPLSLYIHLPWCVRKCPYCDFNSHRSPETLPEKGYIHALIEDFSADLPRVEGRTLSSLFIGGGTPSLFSGKSISTLLTALRKHIVFDPNLEITLEANPGTVDYAHFADYFQAGVNRLSLGIQSFDDRALKKLGRIHSASDTTQAIEIARRAGFENINLDLMYGLPEQTLDAALKDLQTGLSFGLPHFSWYQLTLEPNTVFYKRPPKLPTTDLILSIEDQGRKILKAAGFSQYEVSAYSLPGKQCQHNLNYWTFGDYLGIGAGAHGKVTRATGEIVRLEKKRMPQAYLDPEQPFIARENVIDEKQVAFEFMLNALRLSQSISEDLFFKRTGLRFEAIENTLAEARTLGLIETSSQAIIKTDKGARFLNDLQGLFLV